VRALGPALAVALLLSISIHPAGVEPASVTSGLSRGESVAIVLKTAPRAGTFRDQWRSIVVHIPGSTKSGHVYLAPK